MVELIRSQINGNRVYASIRPVTIVRVTLRRGLLTDARTVTGLRERPGLCAAARTVGVVDTQAAPFKARPWNRYATTMVARPITRATVAE
ncbi:hypothetical protein Aph02nite_12710 [Actinoplanes philippinensis]|nr:hypothetical protein Aph02nite_12710 [Actinoplanes philippinensis]